ncbi:nickel/cobalt efflux transporter [Aestuariispira insulae]|uniref:Nickel/cobalt efflux system n=1 Tax=Aestuariispira insulae TaxID=1461337 RepID=A0A3D9HWA4_9PROT|nr:nickel/cobalt efflux transporter [Aestuariispira insulae]RED53689.1 nickel/cobalt exporter [Aestuariispira insulae]
MDILELLKNGDTSFAALAFIALAVGALHGLEPGHSKTMMAAFIIAVKGTVTQAIQLGLAATVSHSLIVWVLGLSAIYFGNEMIGEELEPWLILVSGIVILFVAAWIFFQTRLAQRKRSHHHHHHSHGGSHSHGGAHSHGGDHSHSNSHHAHNGDGDAHAAAHAREIETRFAGGAASTGQTIMFGLTGGLIPCPAAITVLILCMQTDQIWKGVGLVSAFSVGLAITLVTAGLVAALGLKYASRKSAKVDEWLSKAPYLSAALIFLIGLYMAGSAYLHLTESH